jgi:hypothetical protein
MAAITETPPVTSVKSEPEHQPYVPDEVKMPEFTLPAV